MSKKRTAVLGSLEANKTAVQLQSDQQKKRKPDVDKEKESLSLKERLEALGASIGDEDDAAAKKLKKSRKDGPVTAGNVVSLLEQALHTNDSGLLETCLRIADPTVISTSVSRLSEKYVVALLSQLTQRLQAKPTRASSLVAWIRAILVTHTAYIMRVPEVIASLTSLYSVIDTRLGVFKKLVTLSGRLDLILSLKAAKGKISPGDTAAMAIYNEDQGMVEGASESSLEASSSADAEEEAGEDDDDEGDEEGNDGNQDEESAGQDSSSAENSRPHRRKATENGVAENDEESGEDDDDEEDEEDA
jgi:U3 small nucleolar RNA-associated protein 5